MKISELIVILKEVQDLEGDLEVLLQDSDENGCFYFRPVEEVRLDDGKVEIA